MVICVYEDRQSHLIGAKILLSSLRRHMADAPIHFTCPSVDDELRAWLHAHSSATLDESAVLRG
jgi:hypothetical protein